MSYGVTDSGFIPKTIDITKSELEAAFQAKFGAGIDISASSVFGQIIGVLCDRESELWEMANLVYDAFSPDGATGAALDNLCALTACFRLPATKSSITLTCTGTDATVLSAGRTASVTGTGIKFATKASATLATAASWATATPYVVGDFVTANSKVFVCRTAGSSSGSGSGPASTSSDITDGTAHWRYVGEGAAYANVDCLASVTGPLAGPAFTITTIETPVGGWQNVTNLLDAIPGTNVETDAALRIRRLATLQESSNGTNAAIRDAILKIPTVTSCLVFENDTDAVVGGIAPHAVNCLVEYSGSQLNATDLLIQQTILATKAAGIQTSGSVSGTVTDTQGLSHTVKFDRPNNILLYITAELIIDPSTYPVTGNAQVQAALAQFGESFVAGTDAVASRLARECFNVIGVLDATAIKIGITASPSTTTTVTATPRDVIKIDTSRIVVNTTNGTP